MTGIQYRGVGTLSIDSGLIHYPNQNYAIVIFEEFRCRFSGLILSPRLYVLFILPCQREHLVGIYIR